ncbi:MAG: hypothetical protein ABIO79_10905 [Ferruginibacter sp.]
MTILHIEHPVPNFEGWKKVFDSDPIDRKGSGVTSYRIYRSVTDLDFVAVDLCFNNREDAEKSLAALRKLWDQVDGKIIQGPQARIMDMVETVEL